MQNILFTNFNWKAFTATLVALGIITTADPKLAAVSLLAMLIVLFVNALARTWRIRIGAGWLSIILYAISMFLAIGLNAITYPTLPAYTGDIALFFNGLAKFATDVAPATGLLMTSATLIYNTLKPLVFDKILPTLDAPPAASEQIG